MDKKTIQTIQVISAATTIVLGVIQINNYLQERKRIEDKK